MDLKKYGFLLDQENAELSLLQLKDLANELGIQLTPKVTVSYVEEELSKLVNDFKIPDGTFKSKDFYPNIAGEKATLIRKHILTVNLTKQEYIDNYEALILNWSGSFGELVSASKKL